jgi:hypothetical protein
MKLKKYKWTGPGWGKFLRGDRTYNVFNFTDADAERLLKEDPAYWGIKFEKLPAASPVKKDSGKKEE